MNEDNKKKITKKNAVISQKFWAFLKIRTVYNNISRAEKEERLDLKVSTGRPKKVTQRAERKIIKTVSEVEKGLHVSHETIRNVLEKHKYSLRAARKNPCYHHKI